MDSIRVECFICYSTSEVAICSNQKCSLGVKLEFSTLVKLATTLFCFTYCNSLGYCKSCFTNWNWYLKHRVLGPARFQSFKEKSATNTCENMFCPNCQSANIHIYCSGDSEPSDEEEAVVDWDRWYKENVVPQ